MNETNGKIKVLALIVATTCVLATASAQAQGTIINWQRIVGIDPNPTGGQTFADINPVTFPWSTSRGRARLDPTSGRLAFDVQGLSIGASPTTLAVLGTTGIVTELTGTVLCSSTGEYVDSAPVELSTDGDASFQGSLPYAIACDDESWVFLLRVAGIVPGAPPIIGRWLAHGAVRSLRQRTQDH